MYYLVYPRAAEEKDMSRDLSFWKYENSDQLNHRAVYEALSRGSRMDGVALLPISDILSAVSTQFDTWNKVDNMHFENDSAVIEVFSTPQFVRFDCYMVSEDDMNKLIDVMLAFDCPLYDSVIDTRFDIVTLSRDEASDRYFNELQNLLAKDGFQRQSKSRISRKIGKDTQHISVIVTKYGSYSHITFNANFTYQNIDMIASYIQGIPYRKGFSTGCFRKYDVAQEIVNPCEHKVYDGISAEAVDDYASMDYETIRAYFLPLLSKSDTAEKFYDALLNDPIIQKCRDPHCHIEWHRIAALLHMGKIEDALARFDNWDAPTNYFTRMPMSPDEAEYSRYRIATWDINRKLKNDYVLFGTQEFGVVFPVPKDFTAGNKM